MGIFQSVPNADWIREPGASTRRYVNSTTGEIISRRQYDERYGRLAQQGIATNEAQAKASPTKLRESRPARGRPANRDWYNYGKNLKPIKSKRGGYREGRRFVFPFNNSHRWYYDKERKELDSFIRGLKDNKNIFSLWSQLDYSYDGDKRAVNMQPGTHKDSFPELWELLNWCTEWAADHENSKGIHMISITLGVKFRTQYLGRLK